MVELSGQKWAGKEPGERQRNYRELFVQQIDEEVLEEIRASTHKGMAVGNDLLKEEIERLAGKRLKPKKRGQPVGWHEKKI